MPGDAIHDVLLVPLRQFPDERGRVMHMLRSDAEHFRGFGEVYFSTVLHGAVKAWKLHSLMTLNLSVPCGMVRFVLYDDRPGSSTRGVVQTVEIGRDNHALLQVPPGVWSGFCGVAEGESLICNCADIPHAPQEAKAVPSDDPAIPYRWKT